MDEVSKTGRTILFVSHQLGTLAQLCESCILLEKGRVIARGETEKVINIYLNRQISNSTFYYDETTADGKAAYFIYQKIVDRNGADAVEITNEDVLIIETKIGVTNFHNEMELSLSLQSRPKGRIFTVNKPLREVMKNGEREKVIRLEIPANFVAPGNYSWVSSIHVPGQALTDVLWDECGFFIRDVGTEFARYEGVDYGCVLLSQYKVYAFDD